MDEQERERARKREERRAAVAVRKQRALEEKQEREQKQNTLIYACRRIIYDKDSTPAELAFAVGTLDSLYELECVPGYIKRLNHEQQVEIAAFAAEVERRMNEAG